MTQLIQYEAAKSALAAARNLDEVMKIRNQAEVLKHLGKIAKDRKMEVDAVAMRHLAEFRIGEMLGEATTAGFLRRGRFYPEKHSRHPSKRILLKEIGIAKAMSARCQRLASCGFTSFERRLNEWRSRMLADCKSKIIIDPHSRAMPTTSKTARPASVTLCAGDMRHWSVAKLRRIALALYRISNHCGAADDGVAVGDCISNAKLDALCRGELK